MSEWETYAFRVSWLQSPAFAHQDPEEHEEVVQDRENVFYLLQRLSRPKPVTERGTYGFRVAALQRRTEHREVPCGLLGYERG